MPKKEKPQPRVDLKQGDPVIVTTGGEDGKSQEYEVEAVGKKKVIAKVGNVQLVESSFTLKPTEPKEKSKKDSE